jgi:hypothetical protein
MFRCVPSYVSLIVLLLSARLAVAGVSIGDTAPPLDQTWVRGEPVDLSKDASNASTWSSLGHVAPAVQGQHPAAHQLPEKHGRN